jgi:hypothetical protein
MEPEDGGIEDFIKQVQEDEARDALEEFPYVSIGDFARARGIRPQLIHYYLHTGKLRRFLCSGCGQPNKLDAKEANELFDSLQRQPPPKEEDDGDEGWAVSWIGKA